MSARTRELLWLVPVSLLVTAGFTAVLVARTADGVPAAEELARLTAAREIEVLVVLAPWRAGVSAHARPGTLVFPPAAPWGDVIAACAESATGDRNRAIEDLAARLKADGRKPFVVRYGVSDGLGALGSASSALELAVSRV